MYLIDSTVYIDALRSGKDPVRIFAVEFELGLVFTCGIVTCEVLRGIRDTRVFDRMESFFGLIHTIEFDAALWRASYLLAWKLDRGGSVLPLSDILIASAALREDATLITVDKHFQSIPGLDIRASI